LAGKVLPLWLMRLHIKLCKSDARYRVQLFYTSIRTVAAEVSISLHPFSNSNSSANVHQIRLGATCQQAFHWITVCDAPRTT
jgi:hypothetical protein